MERAFALIALIGFFMIWITLDLLTLKFFWFFLTEGNFLTAFAILGLFLMVNGGLLSSFFY